MEFGLLETDPSGKIVKAHKSFCDLVGYTQKELEGTNGDFMLEKSTIKVMKEQQRKRSLGETGVYEVELICKDNTKKWVIISGAPFYGLNNKFSGSIGIHLDITKRKRIESELILAKNVAEDSLIAKEVFLANISHEIRTPLNAIIGLSQMLNKNDFEPNHKEMLSQVSSASGNLLSLINDLLLMSKLEASGIVLKPDSYSIQNVLKEMIMMLAPSVNEKGVDFIIELNLESSFSHEFDKLRLTQVIQNLLTNAIKFTSEGYVKISANYKKSQEEIEIKIEDSGIGIPEGELNSIFEGFVQASNNNSEVYGGTGLGLSIVNKIVNAMQGNISVRKLKKGSKEFLKAISEEKSKMSIQRFKGLGEMNPDELWNTTLDPETRNLLQVQYSKDLKKDQLLIHTLMGNDVTLRKDFIVSNAINVQNLDI